MNWRYCQNSWQRKTQTQNTAEFTVYQIKRIVQGRWARERGSFRGPGLRETREGCWWAGDLKKVQASGGTECFWLSGLLRLDRGNLKQRHRLDFAKLLVQKANTDFKAGWLVQTQHRYNNPAGTGCLSLPFKAVANSRTQVKCADEDESQVWAEPAADMSQAPRLEGEREKQTETDERKTHQAPCT